MNIQFSRQHLMEDSEQHMSIEDMVQVYGSFENALKQAGASEEAIEQLMTGLQQGLSPQTALDITRATTGVKEEIGTMTTAVAPTLEPVRVKKQQESDGEDAPAFEKGQEVTYLTHPAVITNVEKDRMGRWNYSVSYDKGTGKTKATNILNKDNEIKPLKEDAPILAGGKIKDNYAVSHFGYKEAPRGHAKLKGIIVKDLWEMFKEGSGPFYVVYNKGRGQGKGVSNQYEPFATEKEAQAFADKQNSWEIGMPGGGKYYYVVGPDHDDFEWVSQAAHDERQLDREMGESINENYHRFKKETATRTKAQQMHEAAKAIEKRLHEVNKLLEYTNELRNELFEGDSESQMTHHTKRVFEKVTKNIAEAYSKLKKIK